MLNLCWETPRNFYFSARVVLVCAACVGTTMVVGWANAETQGLNVTATAAIVSGTTNGVVSQQIREGDLLRDHTSIKPYFGQMWMSDVETVEAQQFDSYTKLLIQLEHYN